MGTEGKRFLASDISQRVMPCSRVQWQEIPISSTSAGTQAIASGGRRPLASNLPLYGENLFGARPYESTTM
jgi:hypothetical protein